MPQETHAFSENRELRTENRELAPGYLRYSQPALENSAGTAKFLKALMSLVVKLEDDLGERTEWVMLHGVVPTNGAADYPLLSGIAPFGKTVFNQQQMEAFLREWERAKDRARDESLSVRSNRLSARFRTAA